MIDAHLLSLLRCPKSMGELELIETKSGERFLYCEKSRLAYDIVDDIPDMLIEDAREMNPEEVAALRME